MINISKNLICRVVSAAHSKLQGYSALTNVESALANSLPGVVCSKYHDHIEFTPIRLFQLRHLPVEFRNQELYEFVVNFGKLVVKVDVSCLSESRPPDKEGLQNDLDISEGHHYGSGYLDKAAWHESPCPCKVCREEGNKPNSGWGQVSVYTANHVVFDDYEAWGTKVEYDYDHPLDRSKVRSLSGHRLAHHDVQGDTCEMMAITHSREVLDSIAVQVERCRNTERILSDWEKLTVLQKGNYLTIIVSHPHGFEKHVSVGRCKNRDWNRGLEGHPDHVTYVYDTATCPGSSGAPVLVVGKESKTLRFSPHAGHHKRNRNSSGVGEELHEPVSFLTNLGKDAVSHIVRSESFEPRRKPLLILGVAVVKIKRFYYWSKKQVFRRLHWEFH